jgi:hypothetical protein
MTLISKALTEQLLANGRAQRAAIDKGAEALDFKPLVKRADHWTVYENSE